MRLIDADAFLKALNETQLDFVDVGGDFGFFDETIDSVMNEQPTIDAAPLPCRMGDVVWGIKAYNNGAFRAKQGIVNEMYFGEDMRICICVKNVCRGEWGKKVFATKEEAVAAIERRTDNA